VQRWIGEEAFGGGGAAALCPGPLLIPSACKEPLDLV